jgi:hypothetical protein
MQPNYFQQFSPPQPKTYHLFISHSWDYGDHRDNLGKLIVQQLGQNVYDYAATKDDPIHALNDEQLVNAIYQRIAQAQVFVLPAGMYVGHSRWIPVEIAIANQQGKPIFGVETWGAERSSSIVRKNAAEVVGWNGASIADAIKRWHS